MNLKEYSGVSSKGNKALRTRSALYVPDDMMEVSRNNIYEMSILHRLYNSSIQLQFHYDSFYSKRKRYGDGSSKMYVRSTFPYRSPLLSKSKKEVYV